MNIFEYFTDEVADIERKLDELTRNYSNWSREQVFDSTKEILDEIGGHLKKQNVLLFQNCADVSKQSDLLAQAQRDHAKIEEEIGQIVEVHVDEPNYDEYLRNLLTTIHEHIAFSKKLYAEIQSRSSETDLASLNAQFNDIILHSTDFNSLQPTQ